MLNKSGAAAFDRDTCRNRSITHGPAVHAYANQGSTLNRAGATAFSKDARGEPLKHGPPIHAYAAPRSTLTRAGATAFGKDATARGEPLKHGPPVHAYAGQTSTLRTSGSVAFGSTAPRSTSGHALSRTGLLTATQTQLNQTDGLTPSSSCTSTPKLGAHASVLPAIPRLGLSMPSHAAEDCLSQTPMKVASGRPTGFGDDFLSHLEKAEARDEANEAELDEAQALASPLTFKLKAELAKARKAAAPLSLSKLMDESDLIPIESAPSTASKPRRRRRSAREQMDWPAAAGLAVEDVEC